MVVRLILFIKMVNTLLLLVLILLCFFSTVEDYNIIKVSDEGHNYEIIIEKEKNGVYKTTTYYVTIQGCHHPTISYSYDSNYKILQVEKFRNIVYK